MQPAPEDESLLRRRIASGDSEGVEEFDRFFRPMLVRFLQGRVLPQDQSDLVQETLLAAFQSLRRGDFAIKGALGAWLIGILKHKLADYWKSHKRKDEFFVPLGAAELSLQAVPRAASTIEAALETEQRLSRLPKRHRVILILNLKYGLTTEQIASAIRVPSGSVGRILAEAKRMLRASEKEVKKISGRGDK